MPDPTLVSREDLEHSPIVANCRMNRERRLTGGNGYVRELGFNPVVVLKERIASGAFGRWLDLCCGTGTALMDADAELQAAGLNHQAEIIGVDLVGMFRQTDALSTCLKLIVSSLANWQPAKRCDVVTCVHGLHYIGDKLELIVRAASWLSDEGMFSASLGLENLRFADGRPAGRRIVSVLRKQGFLYDARKRILTCRGQRHVELPFQYIGANDQAGPNYTGQPAVDSYYAVDKLQK